VLQYEALVADPPGQTRKLLDYLELSPEKGCLGFPKLSDSAVNRHRHYAQHLRPFVTRLRPMMSAYGYE
jgi:hypothetical protein